MAVASSTDVPPNFMTIIGVVSFSFRVAAPPPSLASGAENKKGSAKESPLTLSVSIARRRTGAERKE